MKPFIDYLLQFDNLNQQQTDLILSKASMVHLKKEEYISEAGKIPRYVAFLLSGVVRFCYYNNKGEEITSYFIDENNFVSDQPKFEAQIIATEYVQTVTDCDMLTFTKASWDELANTILGWEMLELKIIKKCLTDAFDRRSPLVSEDATSRYLSFLEKFPTIVNRVPLSQIASYLGITQQSLSRIRKAVR